MNDDVVLINTDGATPGVRKNRKNETCDMQAWYVQADSGTLAFARLTGAHGIREHIPADRIYYIVSGQGIFTMNGTDQPVAKGSIITIPKNATYDFRSSGTAPIEFFVDIGIKIDIDTIPST